MTEPTTTEYRWAPQAPLVGIGWVLTAIAVLLAVVGTDPGGRVLLTLAALLLAAISLFGTLARPRLRADEQGVTVRGLFSSRTWAWPEVRIRLAHGRRLGRVTSTVELTVLHDDGLIVFGKLDLGEDPVDVVEQLQALRPWPQG
ncbi:PH domain-containing protein [Kutzneria sp. NPDC052558]|uniref:PH domain-containing protein n=1 Tax=Kutzneria sp. NPDC052558 TaxID=3364121 RepID=UPI0037C63ED8